MNNNFPKILSNIPEGKDLFKAESHKKIASTITNIFESQSDTIEKQIIGLEGEWGTGKSNIIKIIEEDIAQDDNLKDKYVFFNYDTWTHQEDLTRKSILIELINSLRFKIESFSNDYWLDKENELSQKKISKNTKYFPRVKLFYISLVFGFVIIKFVNEIKKQVINNKLYGYYDNSLNYLKDEFYFKWLNEINYTYLYKSIPYIFFLLSILLFLFTLRKDYLINKKKTDKTKLDFWSLVGKSFYWISGEKLESNLDETITEIEPSNLRFKEFLKDIDTELVANNKKLILTIDNTDRLSNDKVKSIWSTINIFFAENNNQNYLKNIWLIIPYDYNKVINSFDDKEVGIGLLEKTFAITFKVPPPLNSNWEEFFKITFNKSFAQVPINEVESELEILLKLYECFQPTITPRSIINFINQLATFYIQNTDIKLRYYGVFCLKKNYFLQGNINDKIINRNYLENVAVLFIEDDNLELNLSKIIYGLEKDTDAEESLLHKLIINKLKNGERFDEEVLNLTYFQTYFYKYFKQFVSADLNKNSDFDMITNLLEIQEKNFIKNKSISLYNELWYVFSQNVFKGEFFKFNNTLKGICMYCSHIRKVEVLNYHIQQLSKRQFDDENSIKISQLTYSSFLINLYEFNELNKIIKINELQLEDYYLEIENALKLASENRFLFSKFKFKVDEKQFIGKIEYKETIQEDIINKHKEYHKEILFIHNNQNFTFLSGTINKIFFHISFKDFSEVSILFFYYEKLDKVYIDRLESKPYTSLVDLINNEEYSNDLFFSIILLILNYKSDEYNIIREDIRRALMKVKSLDLLLIVDRVRKYKNNETFNNIFKIIFDINDIDSINNFALELMKKNLLKLNDEIFNYILKNFTFFNELFNNSDFSFYDYLNKNYNNHSIDISIIDINIFNNSRKKMNIDLIKLSNSHLKGVIEKDNRFLQNYRLSNFKLFIRILELGKAKEFLFNENLATSYCSLALETNVNSFISEENLLIIKSKIESNAIKEFLRLRGNYNLIINRRNSYMLAPEIFSVFNLVNNMLKRRALQDIVTKHKFYTNELIDEIIKLNDTQLLLSLKQNIDNCPYPNVINYAIEKNIIEPNP